MTIDEIYDEFNSIGHTLKEKAKAARATAKAARRIGNTKKWDKFNALSRAYEAVYLDMMPIEAELWDHLSDERKEQLADDIPF